MTCSSFTVGAEGWRFRRIHVAPPAINTAITSKSHTRHPRRRGGGGAEFRGLEGIFRKLQESGVAPAEPSRTVALRKRRHRSMEICDDFVKNIVSPNPNS